MNLTRLLADPPADYRVDQITAPGIVGTNVVDGKIAGYWPDGEAPTQAEWQAIVAAHVPQPDPPTAEERIAELEVGPDPTAARQVRQALTQLDSDATAARALAEQFRTATTTQKNQLVQQRFDDVLDSLADTYDLLAKVIRAVVRDR